MKKTVGVVIGGGTGLQLANIFTKYLKRLVSSNVTPYDIELKRCYLNTNESIPFGSYLDILKHDDPRKQSITESNALFTLYKEWNKAQINRVFRTSVNAEALYLFRSKAKGFKEIGIDTRHGSYVHIIRDMQEGFYANESYDLTPNQGEIQFRGKYTKQRLFELLDIAAIRTKNSSNPIWLVYKYHLFSGVFEIWLKEWKKRENNSKYDVILYQPDTAFTNLFEFIRRSRDSRLVLVCSNEIGDLIYEPLIESVQGISDKLSLYTKSALFFDNKELIEYQTVHGSADDKVLSMDVLPYSTFRIIAAIAEEEFGIKNCRAIMDQVMAEVIMDLYDHKAPKTVDINNAVEKQLISRNLIKP